MHINSKDFYVREGKKVDLKKWPTLINPFYKSDEDCRKIIAGACPTACFFSRHVLCV